MRDDPAIAALIDAASGPCMAAGRFALGLRTCALPMSAGTPCANVLLIAEAP
jgi:hypothetical protein